MDLKSDFRLLLENLGLKPYQLDALTAHFKREKETLSRLVAFQGQDLPHDRGKLSLLFQLVEDLEGYLKDAMA